MTSFQISSSSHINQRTILRRYIDLQKLLDLLHTREFYFRRADGFPDRLEGALFPSLRASIDKVHAEGTADYNADDFYRRARIGNFVSCWTMNGKDSMALWQLYGGVHHSVAITTTVERIIKTAFSWERDVHIYRVKYINHMKMKNYIIGNFMDVLQFKHKAYKYENELRLIVPQQGETWEENPIALRLPVEKLDQLVLSVIVAPEADNEFFDAVRGLCSRYGLRSPVRRSRLTLVPI
jgi:hypothetical protein